MLGVGFLEILVIALVGFVVLGPKQLPIAMRKMAQYYRKFLNLKEDFNYQLLHADLEEKKPQKPELKFEDKNHG
jgi:Tat protein translocase TatB subunit